ncbi:MULTISPECIES: MGMT family protein [unclassified Iodidimonas]|jgi:methylated-DNA-protein-cysteine methyltransferase-like protein|uniref:MGMT family protein n=1 Tax=unclassified Iodidimonas TaxID=2626145 RepID=UPI00248290D8|nr:MULTISPECIES: MGMT family protein [unclassified Iodidimonas]
MTDQKFAKIHALVALIPLGEVASYGQIAAHIPGVTARLVGFAMAGLGDKAPRGGVSGDEHTGDEAGLPWHRVVNAKGTISGHAGAAEQRRRLEAEGIHFDAHHRLDMKKHGWSGPDPLTLMDLGLDPETAFNP